MKPRFRSFFQLSCCLIFCFQQTDAAEIAKLTNTTALNLPGSWDGDVVPGAGDVMLWNNLYVFPSAAGNLAQLGADFSVSGLKVTDVGGTRNVNQTLVGFQNASSANTLTIGAQGLDLSAALQSLMIQSKITIGANQTWSIANANTAGAPAGFNNNEDLAIFSQLAGAPIDFGGHTVTTTGAGQVTITSGYTLSNGNLTIGNNLFVIQGGSNRVTNINDTLNIVVNSGELRLQSNSGAGGLSLVSAAPITLNAGNVRFLNNSLTLNQTGPVTVNGGTVIFGLNANSDNTYSGPFTAAGDFTWDVISGGNGTTFSTVTGNLSGAGNILYRNTATGAQAFSRLSGDNSGYTGTFNINGGSNNRILRLSSATAGSAAATWNVAALNTLQIDGVSVQLGTLTGAGIITNSSAGTPATINVGAGLFGGVINDGASQPISLNKVGDGTLVLTAESNYTGATTVSGGTLTVLGERFAGGPVSVADDASFRVTLVDGGAYEASALTIGGTTGGNVHLDLGALGNPAFAPLIAEDLAINGASTVSISGKNLAVGNVPLIEYTNIAGSTGFAGLSLLLPPRTVGTLTDSGFGISANITAIDQIKWNGNISNNWDTSTLNWLTVGGNTATAYLQGPAGSDIVNFDDSASGSGTVNLTTDLSPGAVTFNNAAKAYTLTGPGKLVGPTLVEKTGNGTVTFANPTPFEHTGGTLITAGTLRLGDGVTEGAGQIIGSIEIGADGRLVLDRPEDHDLTNAITGEGTIEKAGDNVLSVTVAANILNNMVLSGGRVRFTAGGTLGGVISGPGELESAGGTLTIQGIDANTYTGLTTVSGGSLRLSNPPETNAVGGDIQITGGATLAIVSPEQIPDTATIYVLGTSGDSLVGTNSKETIANAVVDGVSAATQMVTRNDMTITGTATVNQGILGVASGHNATFNKIVVTSPTGLLRIAGSGGPSIMNVGAGGITASAGEMQVKFNGNNQDATLNLAGDFTATGDFRFTNAGYTGANLNMINLIGARTFNIAADTLTTIAPDIATGSLDPEATPAGSLIKAGGGTLTLTAASTANPDSSTVDAGTLLVNGTLSGTTQVNAGGTIGGTGTLTGGTTVEGAVSPGGTAIGRLNSSSSVTLAPGSSYDFQIGSWAGATPGTHWDLLAAEQLTITATPAAKHVVRVTGTPADFEETGKSLVIANSIDPLAGFNAGAIEVDASGFIGTGTWAATQSGNSIALTYTPGAGGSAYDLWAAALPEGQRGATADPDNDGLPNFAEFALNSSPTSGVSSENRALKLATVGAETALTLTIPVRANAVFAGATAKSASIDGVTYHVQAGDNLAAWDLVVTEVLGADATAIQQGLPALDTGWTYRTFRSPGPIAGDPQEFIRVVIDNN